MPVRVRLLIFARRATPSRLAGLFAAALLLASPTRLFPAQDAPLPVVVSILPLGDFARQVGGAAVNVRVLVPPGQNPHVLNFKPSQLRMISRARLLVLNGLGLEFWATKVVAALDPPHPAVVRCAEGFPEPPARGSTMMSGEARVPGAAGAPIAAGLPNEEREHDPDYDHAARHRQPGYTMQQEHHPPGGQPDHEEQGEAAHGQNGMDPHVWLDPVLAMQQVTCIRDALARADPPRAREYHSRAASYMKELEALHGEFARALAPAAGRTFISFHEGYGHLARRYGLVGLGVVEGFSDLEPSPGRMARVIREVRRLRAKVIFAEPQFSPVSARLIARETGARVAFLDPLGNGPGDKYVTMMRRNLAELRKALLD